MHRLAILLLVLVSCAAPEPPAVPPAYTDPPPPAETGGIRASTTATVPMTPPELRAFLTERPMTSFLSESGSLAPPAATEVLRGDWPMPGAARWVRLADGHYIVERVLENEPERFRYQIWTFTNAAGRGVDQIVAEQRFVPVGTDQTRFEWDYVLYPKSMFTCPFVARFKDDELQPYLSDGTAAMAKAANDLAQRGQSSSGSQEGEQLTVTAASADGPSELRRER